MNSPNLEFKNKTYTFHNTGAKPKYYVIKNVSKSIIGFILWCLSTAGHWSCPLLWFIYTIKSYWRKLRFFFFFCEQLSVEESFWIRSEGFCPVPLLALEPHLAWTCVSPVPVTILRSLWVRMHISSFVSERPCSLEFSIPSYYYKLSTSSSTKISWTLKLGLWWRHPA